MEVTAPPATSTEDLHSPGAGFRPAVLVVLAILGVAGDRVVTLLRSRSPGVWTLPARAPAPDQPLDDAARLEVRGFTGEETALEQLYTRTDTVDGGRDRVLQVGYLALAPLAGENTLSSSVSNAYAWWPLSQLPRMEAGAPELLRQAHERLRYRLTHANLAWSLLPGEFSLSELQRVYEVVQGRTLDKRNFRKWILGTGLVEPTPHERRDGAHRPARLYRFTTREPVTIA